MKYLIPFLAAVGLVIILSLLQKYVSAWFFSDFFNGWICACFYIWVSDYFGIIKHTKQ